MQYHAVTPAMAATAVIPTIHTQALLDEAGAVGLVGVTPESTMLAFKATFFAVGLDRSMSNWFCSRLAPDVTVIVGSV